MKGHDESMVQGWKEDVDTLLVFAGLFSAVLTAFTIESYQQLQDNPVQTTAELLRYIVVELSNRTLPAPTVDHRNILAESFQPSPASVRVNTLWFSALVCSLVAALIGILAKQWLREYLIKVSSSPQETVRLRQYRNDGLRRWHVVTIMAMLPVLLELALVLFLLGLLDFLWQLNTTVAAVITFLVGVSFLFYTVTTVLPAFFASSPFKSPQAWGFCKLLWSFRRLRRFVRPLTPIDVMFGDADMYHSLPDNWRERDIGFVRRMAGMLDHRALAWIYKSSLNEDLLDMMVPYISNLQPDEAASLAFEEIARKGECTVTVLIDSIRDNQPRIGLPKFIRRAGERGKRRLANMLLHILPRMDHNARHSGITAFDILFVLRTLLIESERAICEMSIHRRTNDKYGM
ncbi:hypothetical protein PHLCEN_2v1809 [Hermanssonia centrifuga]|uniref:DUF6535 domain-containing protein n=1 Tax=Hermanssonia centrifuga TaxID=98765 RepID=A0A2R6RVT1_9APHY|nr:hypothetical protein PHLCEN_2v1809 [Hermanssonia centrifuga]